MTRPQHRGSVFLEQAQILSHAHYDGEQHLLRLAAPQCAATARPGQFVHLQCDAHLPMRRPISLQNGNPDEGTIELLYKAVGEGTRLLASQPVGYSLSVLGPIGTPFTVHADKPVRLLMGGGVGMPPLLFLAKTLAKEEPGNIPTTQVLLGSEVTFPFDTVRSNIRLDHLPQNVDSAHAGLEALGIASRLSSLQGFTGSHNGYVTNLASVYLDTLDDSRLAQVELFACGPQAMLDSVRALALQYRVSCQVSLEEHMACGIGGCAGCVVRVSTPEGEAMKRVCVDGPVFDAASLL